MPFELKVDVDEDCTICCEPLNHDVNFYPCACGFQLCSMCWHRIKNDEDNRCPNCRDLYGDEPYKFSPLTPDQELRLKELRSREQNQGSVSKSKTASISTNSSVELNREKLSQVRVMQKNLVFVVGLSTKIAEECVLRRNEYFGKFGKILKVAVNQSTSYAGTQGPSASAYVTYSSTDAALKCIQEVNGSYQDGRTLKATLGTTKYCSRFLNGQTCKLADCMYLHEVADDEASFTKDDMSKQKHSEYEKSLMDSFQRKQKERLEKEIKSRALVRAQADAEARMRAEMLRQTKLKPKPADQKTRESSSPLTPSSIKHSRINCHPLSNVPSNGGTSVSKNKKDKSKPKNDKKIKKIEKPIIQNEESEEEKEEEEVKDAWDSSDEEIENEKTPVVNTSGVYPLVCTSSTPTTTTPPVSSIQQIKITTPATITIASVPPAKDIPEISSPTVPIQAQHQQQTQPSSKQIKSNQTSTKSSRDNKLEGFVCMHQKQKPSDRAVNEIESLKVIDKLNDYPEIRLQKICNVTPAELFPAALAIDISSRVLTPSPPIQHERKPEVKSNDSFLSRLNERGNPEKTNHRGSVDVTCMKHFDPFAPDKRSYSPMFPTTNGTCDVRDSRPHSNNSGNSLNGTLPGLSSQTTLHSSFGQNLAMSGNSLVTQLEKRSSPPGISSSVLQSGPPGLSGKVPHNQDIPPPLNLFNSRNAVDPNKFTKSFDPFDFRKPSVIQGLSNGNSRGLNGSSQSSGVAFSSLKGPFGGHDLGTGLAAFKDSIDPRFCQKFNQPPPPGFIRERPKNDLEWDLNRPTTPSNEFRHFFGRQISNEQLQFEQQQPQFTRTQDPFAQVHNGFGNISGLENGFMRGHGDHGSRKPTLKDEDGLGFDPSQYALEQLGSLSNKLNDINISNNNRHANNKQRLGHSPPEWIPFGGINSYGTQSALFDIDRHLRNAQQQMRQTGPPPPTLDLRSSQEVFKKLLPNANLHFSDNLSYAAQNRLKSQHETQPDIFKAGSGYSQVRNPPPGFSQYQDTPANAHLPSNLLDFE